MREPASPPRRSRLSPRPLGPSKPLEPFISTASPSIARPEARPDTLELFCSSSGRLSRLPFLTGEATVLAVLWLYDRCVGGWPRRLTGWAVLALAMFSGCCLLSRRLHDLGRAGWWTALYFVLFLWAWPHPRSWAAALLALPALELCLRPGQARANRFGAALRGRNVADHRPTRPPAS